MAIFENCIFDAQGASKKDKVYGIIVNGIKDVEIKSCQFKNTGYAGILNNCEGKLNVSDCEFDCGNIYNPIEGSQSVENDNVYISNCSFNGIPGNNFINFYKVKDCSAHTISNCVFAGSTANNIVRLSNLNNSAAKFFINNCKYSYISGEADEYTGFMLCQDYTNEKGNKQDFSKYEVEINNLIRPEEGSIFYVYEDGKGIITGENDPAITVR